MNNKKLNILTIIAVLIVIMILNNNLGRYPLFILNMSGIFVIYALSMNLINGYTGLFSLGHAGFIAIGAYTSSILTMGPKIKTAIYIIEPINPLLLNIQLPFWISLLIGGLVAAGAAFLVGAPILRLKDDYLAIATLGFAEITVVVFMNINSITNGALGIKGIERYTNIWWTWGTALIVIVVLSQIIRGSYGKAFMSIREDEIAAEAMGINLFKHKIISFTIGAFIAGIGGGLHAHLIGTIDPKIYIPVLTFNILLIVVLGGSGSISGSVISGIVFTVLMEQMRVLDDILVQGSRMVIFSILLMSVVLFYPKGLMGRKEVTWSSILNNRFLNSRQK